MIQRVIRLWFLSEIRGAEVRCRRRILNTVTASRRLRNNGVPQKPKSYRGGFASLPVVMILVILVTVVGIGITSVTLSETFIAAGQNQASLAYVYAEAGAHDALLRLAKDKTYSCASADCYTIDFSTNGCAQNTGCARMSVSTASGTPANPKIITATGQVKNNVRRLQVSVVYDAAVNGEFSTTTWTELTN